MKHVITKEIFLSPLNVSFFFVRIEHVSDFKWDPHACLLVAVLHPAANQAEYAGITILSATYQNSRVSCCLLCLGELRIIRPCI